MLLTLSLLLTSFLLFIELAGSRNGDDEMDDVWVFEMMKREGRLKMVLKE